MNFTVGDDEMVGLAFLEVRDGLISRVTDFWPEPYEAPAGREHLTEEEWPGSTVSEKSLNTRRSGVFVT